MAKRFIYKNVNPAFRGTRLTYSVTQKTMDGEPIRDWYSVKEASEDLGLQQSHISRACNGLRNHCGGFKWEYGIMYLKKKEKTQKWDVAGISHYQYFVMALKGDKRFKDIGKQIFVSVCLRYGDLLMNSILYEGKKAKLPCGMGSMEVLKFKPRIFDKTGRITLFIDYQATRQAGKVVYRTFEARDGYAFRFKWTPASCVKNSRYYTFRATRDGNDTNRQKLRDIYHNHPEIDYFEEKPIQWRKKK